VTGAGSSPQSQPFCCSSGFNEPAKVRSGNNLLEGSDWILRRISSQKEWSGIGTACPGKWQSLSLEASKERVDVVLSNMA